MPICLRTLSFEPRTRSRPGRLKTSAFTIRQCTVFGPVIDVRAAATRAGDGVCRLLGVKSTVNLGKMLRLSR